MPNKPRKIKLIFFIYWFLLAYIIAALVWWYIALTRQNDQMTNFKLRQLKPDDVTYYNEYLQIQDEKKRKLAQYIGEGSIFFLLIGAGAIFVYRSVNKQLKTSQQQQNFMMAVTHELKTPLAIAKLNLETLQKRKLDEQVQQKLLMNTLEEANRMNTLCNNMLLSSQIEGGGYRIAAEELNLAELTANCFADFASRYPQRSLQNNSTEDVFVHGDNLLLQMAINNLIENAIKYSPREKNITVTVTRNKEGAMVAIADEGPGIHDAEKKKIFEKFYRTGNDASRKAKGTGLGLYLVQKIIAAHQGKITVADNQPQGSIFTIQLKQVV